jgi:hypothetical protein
MKYYTLLFIFVFMSMAWSADDFPLLRDGEKDPFPQPRAGQQVATNPPAFIWLPVDDAETYTLTVTRAGQEVEQVEDIPFNVYVPDHLYEPGTFSYSIRAYGKDGNLLATHPGYRFTVADDAIAFPFPDISTLFDRIASHHPRLIFDLDHLEKIRQTLGTTRQEGWQQVKKLADKSLHLGLPEPPPYGPIEEYNARRVQYRKYYHYLRPFVDQGLQSLALAWLMTGEEKYATAGKRLLLHLASWDPDGITSSNHIGFDEPGLSLARCMHRAYDWLYTALSEKERMVVRENVIARSLDTWKRLKVNRPYLQQPGSSHDARLIGYLCEQAMVLKGEIPDEDVQEWLEYSLTAYYTVFPHWAGEQGGWAEGIGYAAAYNSRATIWIESCVATMGLDLWQKPFFAKLKDYFLYCAPPNAEMWPFGDGSERGPVLNPSRAMILKPLMSHYAQRFEDPACQWWADQVPIETVELSNPIIPLILEKTVTGEPPTGRIQAKNFQGIGLSALHSDLADLENDVFFLFKSSPYGSISHSHADQNAFFISLGGKALAIPSGFYGPVYGMPHHAEWTRATKANNAILVDGKGQVIRDFTATGTIVDFEHGEHLSYLCGDATAAYKGRLEKWLRHVVFVRPNLFVILDDVIAPEPVPFQWLLHSWEPMQIDASEQSIVSSRDGAQLKISLFSSLAVPLRFAQSDSFDTPYLTGVDQALIEQMGSEFQKTFMKTIQPQYHFTAATTKPQKHVRFVSVMVAGQKDESLPTPIIEQKDGWIHIHDSQNGSAMVQARIEPEGCSGFPLRVRWRNENDRTETLLNGKIIRE